MPSFCCSFGDYVSFSVRQDFFTSRSSTVSRMSVRTTGYLLPPHRFPGLGWPHVCPGLFGSLFPVGPQLGPGVDPRWPLRQTRTLTPPWYMATVVAKTTLVFCFTGRLSSASSCHWTERKGFHRTISRALKAIWHGFRCFEAVLSGCFFVPFHNDSDSMFYIRFPLETIEYNGFCKNLSLHH